MCGPSWSVLGSGPNPGPRHDLCCHTDISCVSPFSIGLGDGDAAVEGRLRAAVRSEFAVELIHADPDNPVFARGWCQVHGCERGAWTRLLCGAHYEHWRRAGPVDRDTFLATAPPIRGVSDRIDTFDLRGLTPQLPLEVAYSIQCRHDDRTVRLLPTMIIRLVDLVAAAKVASLLDHSLQRWTVLAH